MRTSRPVRILSLAGAGALLLSVAGCGGTDNDEPLLSEGTLVVAMSGEFRPFSHFDGGDLTGFDYDIAAAVADELGLELDAQTGAFDTLIQGVHANRYDVLIASMTPTPERAEAVDFSDPYYSSGAQVFVRTDSDCQDPEQMDSPTLGVASATTYDTYLADVDWVGDVRTFTSDITALDDTEIGRLDGAMTDRLVGLHQITEADKDLRECGDPLYTEEPAFAVRSGNAELLEDLNGALATIIENGTYAEISNTWFGTDILGGEAPASDD